MTKGDVCFLPSFPNYEHYRCVISSEMANNNKNATLKPRSINLLDIQEELFSPEPTLAAGDPESLGGGVVVNYTGDQKCFTL
jgi:hypothetical protein